MKKEYKKRKGENLAQWCKRLSDDVLWGRFEPKDINEILSEVSKTSYIQGSRDVQQIILNL